jgi:hypothetical protein
MALAFATIHQQPVMGKVKYFILEPSKSIILLEGSQASPACPDKGNMNVKTLEWLEADA